MPRHWYRPRKSVLADGRYNSALVARFVSKLNFCGKKTLSTKILYRAMDTVAQKTKEDPLSVLSRAVENCRPHLETRPRQVGGATYQVPIEVRPFRGETLSMRWLVLYAQNRKGAPMHERLADEIAQAAKREGMAFKKCEEMHKMAESNRAFAHYRW